MERFKGFWLILLISLPLLLGYLILSLVTAYYPPLGIILLVGLLVTLWALYNPAQPLLLAFFLFPFGVFTMIFPPQVAGPQGITLLSTITVPKAIIVITFIAWLTRTLVLKDYTPIRRLSGNLLPLSIFLFVVISIASLMKAHDRTLFFFFEVRFLGFIVMYFLLIIWLVQEEMLLKRILQALLVAYVFVGLMGFYEILSQTHVQKLLGYPLREVPYTISVSAFRVLGPYGDPNFFAIMMVFASGIALLFLRLESSKRIKAVLILVLLLFFFNILGSGSRGALVAYLAAVVTFLFFSRLGHKWLIAVLVLSVMSTLLIIYTLTISERTLGRYTGYATVGIEYRIGLSRMAVEMTKDNPILGVGTGNFIEAHNRYIDPLAPREPSWPYNVYLQVLAENGLLGLLAYLSIYLFAFLNLYEAIKRSRDPTVRSMAISFLSILVGLAVFVSTHNIQGVEEIYWLIFAFSLITWRLSKLQEEKG